VTAGFIPPKSEPAVARAACLAPSSRRRSSLARIYIIDLSRRADANSCLFIKGRIAEVTDADVENLRAFRTS
jgi:hypothetical protein